MFSAKGFMEMTATTKYDFQKKLEVKLEILKKVLKQGYELKVRWNINRIVGNNAVFLLQGIGSQCGKLENVRHAHNQLVSLGRGYLFN